mgnify:CR=1 FL=1
MKKLLTQAQVDNKIKQILLNTPDGNWNKYKQTFSLNGGSCLAISISRFTVSVNFITTNEKSNFSFKLGNYFSEELVTDPSINFTYRKQGAVTYEEALAISIFLRKLSYSNLERIIRVRKRGEAVTIEKIREILGKQKQDCAFRNDNPEFSDQSSENIASDDHPDNVRRSNVRRSKQEIKEEINLLDMKIRRAELIKQLKQQSSPSV